MIKKRFTCWKPDFVEFGFPPFLAPLSLIFLKGNGPKWGTWPTTALFRPIFVAIILFFDMNRLHLNKEYHCNKSDAKRSSSWSGTPFWPISLRKNQQKGCQQVWKTNFHQIRFSATIPRYKRSTPAVFWGEKRPWVECGGSIRKHSVPTEIWTGLVGLWLVWALVESFNARWWLPV